MSLGYHTYTTVSIDYPCVLKCTYDNVYTPLSVCHAHIVHTQTDNLLSHFLPQWILTSLSTCAVESQTSGGLNSTLMSHFSFRVPIFQLTRSFWPRSLSTLTAFCLVKCVKLMSMKSSLMMLKVLKHFTC